MRTYPRLFALILAILLPMGCGGDDTPSTPATNALDGTTLSASTVSSLARVYLSGLPTTKTPGNIGVLVAAGELEVSLPTEIDDEGTFFWAPLHPVTPNQGGEVAVRVTQGTDQGPDLALSLDALPAAPGAYERMVTTLTAHVEQRATWAGTAFSGLQATTFEDVEPSLLPLKVAQSFVDSDEPNDMASLVANSNDFLSADERELLDRIFGYAPVYEIIQAEIDEFSSLNPAMIPPVKNRQRVSKRDCIDQGPDISSPEALSSAMLLGAFSNAAIDPTGPAGRTLEAMGTVLSAGGTIPGYGAVFSVAGVGLAAWEASAGFFSGVYPSRFTSLMFDMDKTEFPEDEVGVGEWSGVRVVAVSNGWTADAAIARSVLSTLGASVSVTQQLQIQTAEFLRDGGIAAINAGLGNYLEGQGGVVEFCPKTFDVTITGLPWSTGGVLDRRFSVDPDTRQVRPLEVGPDVLRIAVQPSQFAGQEIHTDLPLNTRAINVDVSPTDILVSAPGDTVQITAAIANANNESLEWINQQGTWLDGLSSATNDGRTRPLKTPTEENDFPFLVTVESMSRDGLRATGIPPRLGIVTVRLVEQEILVSPAGVCIENGDPQVYSATLDGEDVDVVWSLEDPSTGVPSGSGSIDQNGRYTAPASGIGDVLVVATSVDNENVRGGTIAQYGACVCYWTVSISNDGSWSGDVATHQFPGDLPGFSLSLVHFDTSQPGIGSVLVSEGAPGPGDLGTWDAQFTFLAGQRAWVAGDEDTPATLSITSNDGAVIVGSVSGTAATPTAQGVEFRSFTIGFRSALQVVGEAFCGDQ